jgi:hypothetical protein
MLLLRLLKFGFHSFQASARAEGVEECKDHKGNGKEYANSDASFGTG